MSVLDDLSRLSAAEEFFVYLGVDYEQAVVNVARLHILRRMGQYLRDSQEREVFARMDDEEVKLLCRDHLAKAYQDFIVSTPIQERLFKVHKDAVAPKTAPAKPFVPLTSLTGSV
ncbi:nitrogenase stabilizing/protective protein NifW [Acidocella sp.]|uniref:nitrogenase stabilizing/protective protein NifW n=1 Tax=Acidocella sp. TaxID=50710 RepID=UPI003D093AD3